MEYLVFVRNTTDKPYRAVYDGQTYLFEPGQVAPFERALANHFISQSFERTTETFKLVRAEQPSFTVQPDELAPPKADIVICPEAGCGRAFDVSDKRAEVGYRSHVAAHKRNAEKTPE